jgi:hypothetical protein
MYKNAGSHDNTRGKAKAPAESNTTNIVPIIGPRNERPRWVGCSNLKQLQSKQYVFRQDLVRGLFEQMNQQKLLNFPIPARPDQIAMTDNPLSTTHTIGTLAMSLRICIALKECCKELSIWREIVSQAQSKESYSPSSAALFQYYISTNEQCFLSQQINISQISAKRTGL